MVDSKDWKTSSGSSQKGPQLFTALKVDNKVKAEENKLAQPKPIEEAEAQPGNKNPQPAPKQNVQIGAAFANQQPVGGKQN